MKKCIGEISCACGEVNKVKYNKPNHFTPTFARWRCENCWSIIQTKFQPLKGEQGMIKQDSTIVLASDKLNRILFARAEKEKLEAAK